MSNLWFPVSISGRRFETGGVGHNNPIKQLLWEAQQQWYHNPQTRNIRAIVSIGTGQLSRLDSRNLDPLKRTLVAIAKEAGDVSADIQGCSVLEDTNVFFRFDVGQVSYDDLDETQDLSGLEARMAAYARTNQRRFTACSERLSDLIALDNRPSYSNMPNSARIYTGELAHHAERLVLKDDNLNFLRSRGSDG